MLRTVLIIVWVLLITPYFGTFVLVLSLLGLNGNSGHRVAQLWGRSLLLGSGIRVRIKGLRRIQASRTYIYMPNHQSNFDIPVLLGCLPVQFRWLAKAELFKIPIFGPAMRACGYISIDRSNRRSAIQSLNQAADAIRGGVSVLIFPEGTRSRDGLIRDFKKGGFVLALKAGVPIVPIVLHHTFSIMSKDSLRITPRDVVLEILEPIETTPYTYSQKADLMDRVRRRICEAFGADREDRQPC